MAVPTKNRKKGGFWKGLLWLVVAVLVLNACVDGAILGRAVYEGRLKVADAVNMAKEK